MKNILLSKTLAILLFFNFWVLSSGKILLVYQIGRHGARSDSRTFNGILEDENLNYKINDLTLTKFGLRQTYQRGVDIVNRYSELLEDSDLSQVKVRASNSTRWILSAYSQLLGMYGSDKCRVILEQYTSYDKTKEINNLKDLDVDTRICLKKYLTKVEVQKSGDSRFQMLDKDCALCRNLTSTESRSERTKRLFDNYDLIIQEWAEKFYPYIKQGDHSDFCGYLISIVQHGLKLNPSLFNNDYPHDKIINLWGKYQLKELKEITTRSPLLWRILSSDFLKDIIHAFDEVVYKVDNLKDDRMLYYLDSGHDTNLLPVLRALGTDYPQPIPFASSLFFELHEDDINSELFVKVYLNDIELDINVLDQIDLSSAEEIDEPEEITEIVKTEEKIQYLDEPDVNSSLYYYLRRFLLRRVLSEDVDSYWGMNLDYVSSIESLTVVPKESQSQTFFFVLFVSTLMIITISGIAILIYINKHKDQKMVRMQSPKDLPIAGKHFRFQDEENTDFWEITTKDAVVA